MGRGKPPPAPPKSIPRNRRRFRCCKCAATCIRELTSDRDCTKCGGNLYPSTHNRRGRPRGTSVPIKVYFYVAPHVHATMIAIARATSTPLARLLRELVIAGLEREQKTRAARSCLPSSPQSSDPMPDKGEVNDARP